MLGWNPSCSLCIAVIVLQTLAVGVANPQRARSHRPIAKRVDNSASHLNERAEFVNQEFTWYPNDTGPDTCTGKTHQDSDFYVAMANDQFGDGSNCCGKQVTITVRGLTATATCVDMCQTCSGSALLDMTKGLFEFFTGGEMDQFTNAEEHVSQDDLRLKADSLLIQPVPVVAENVALPHINAVDGEETVTLRLCRVEAQLETLLNAGLPEGSPPSYAV
ncbi:hypothetical protein B0H14DRAFT_3442553 [Mycena olivaceomarginata]|nr:hypothetical protein B0H14DRAFT_3442553 [Mycena olivaceomarginata]